MGTKKSFAYLPKSKAHKFIAHIDEFFFTRAKELIELEQEKTGYIRLDKSRSIVFNVFYMKLDMSFGMDFEIDLRHEAGDFEHFSYYVRVYFDSDFLSTGEVETRE